MYNVIFVKLVTFKILKESGLNITQLSHSFQIYPAGQRYEEISTSVITKKEQ